MNGIPILVIFLAVGMMLDLHAIYDRPLFVVSMALALVAGLSLDLAVEALDRTRRAR